MCRKGMPDGRIKKIMNRKSKKEDKKKTRGGRMKNGRAAKTKKRKV